MTGTTTEAAIDAVDLLQGLDPGQASLLAVPPPSSMRGSGFEVWRYWWLSLAHPSLRPPRFDRR